VKIIRATTILLPLAIAAAAWSGQSPVGTWKGHIVFDASKMALKDPSQVGMAKRQMASAETILVIVTIKADKTFTGDPPPTTGTWTMKGNQVVLSASGKPGGQVFVLSKDGKTMTNTMPPSQGIVTKIVLKKS
jgi:hypothetical protein